MRRAEVEAVGEVAGDGLAAVAGTVRDMHAAVAARPFDALGPAAAPVRVLHDGISGMVHGAVGLGLRAAARGTGRAAAALREGRVGPLPAGADGGTGAPGDASRDGAAQPPSLAERPRAALALGALNGIWGDALAARESPLALELELRRDGASVEATPAGLAAAFPDATPHVAVFVHGLCETDAAWRLGGGPTYGERLRDDLGVTPVDVRCNTGRRISDNGRALADALEALVAGWPVPVERIALVGHSMGGLIARAACHVGTREGHAWTPAVRHVVGLGTPHLGADLEKGANALGWALASVPETRALAALLNARSVGIKDLRYGSCAEEDWRDADPDELLRDRCGEVPHLPHATYCFVGASLREGPLGEVLGDLLVRSASASGRGNGRGRTIPFEADNGLELHGLTHFALLNHPAVYEQLRAWLAA